MGFLSSIFESPQERMDRFYRDAMADARAQVIKQMPDIQKKCYLLKCAFPYGYGQMEKKYQSMEYPYKEQAISNSGEAMVVEEANLLNTRMYSNDSVCFPTNYTPLRHPHRVSFNYRDEPKLKDEYYDIVNGKYIFNIGKAIKAFSLLKTLAGYDPQKPERERRAKDEAARQEILRREERRKMEEESELIRKGISPRLFSSTKSDKEQILELLRLHNVRYLYHFTSRKNIPLIIKHGGLFSWSYLENHNIMTPVAGGSDTSRSLDKRYGLEDYVRLSFCSNHPMAQRLRDEGEDVITLRIDIMVATLRETLFSDINATDNNHQIGGSINDLRRVDFEATQRSRIYSFESDFKKHQAEILVKTHVPLKYILTNIENYK